MPFFLVFVAFILPLVLFIGAIQFIQNAYAATVNAGRRKQRDSAAAAFERKMRAAYREAWSAIDEAMLNEKQEVDRLAQFELSIAGKTEFQRSQVQFCTKENPSIGKTIIVEGVAQEVSKDGALNLQQHFPFFERSMILTLKPDSRVAGLINKGDKIDLVLRIDGIESDYDYSNKLTRLIFDCKIVKSSIELQDHRVRFTKSERNRFLTDQFHNAHSVNLLKYWKILG